MQLFARVGVVVSLACGLVACGGGAKIGGGKEGAASALFSSTGPAKTNGALLSLAGQGAGAIGEITVDCEFGGKATLKGFTVEGNLLGGGGLTQSFTTAYDNCTTTTYDNPETPAVETDKVSLSGEMTFTQKLNFDLSAGASGNVEQTIKGKINFGGAFNDYLDANVTQTVDWSKLGTRGGSVTITLDGTIATSTESHTYNKETLSITAGTLVAAHDHK